MARMASVVLASHRADGRGSAAALAASQYLRARAVHRVQKTSKR